MEKFAEHRPYNGHRLLNCMEQIKNEIIKGITDSITSKMRLLNNLGKVVSDTKDFLHTPTEINIKEDLDSIVRKTNNTLKEDLKKIDNFFKYLKENSDSATIFLNKTQSLIRKHIKEHPAIKKQINETFDYIGIKEFLGDTHPSTTHKRK